MTDQNRRSPVPSPSMDDEGYSKPTFCVDCGMIVKSKRVTGVLPETSPSIAPLPDGGEVEKLRQTIAGLYVERDAAIAALRPFAIACGRAEHWAKKRGAILFDDDLAILKDNIKIGDLRRARALSGLGVGVNRDGKVRR
jgi:hypothetical protein